MKWRITRIRAHEAKDGVWRLAEPKVQQHGEELEESAGNSKLTAGQKAAESDRIVKAIAAQLSIPITKVKSAVDLLD